MPSTGMLSVTPLCGNILAPLINNSSITWTSSPRTEMLSTRVHLPTVDFQPMMDLLIHELHSTITPPNKAEFWSRTPSSITQLGPIETLGPIKQSFPIFAVGSFVFENKTCWVKKRKCRKKNSRSKQDQQILDQLLNLWVFSLPNLPNTYSIQWDNLWADQCPSKIPPKSCSRVFLPQQFSGRFLFQSKLV